MPRLIDNSIQPMETPREGRFSWAGLLRATGLLCVGASWLVPNHYLPWLSFHSDALAFAGLLAWLMSLCADSGTKLAVPSLAVVFCAAAAVPWAQFAFGQIGFAGEAWIATLYTATLAGSVLLGYQWARHPADRELVLKTLVAAVVVAGFVSMGLCLFQWLRLEDWLGIFIVNMGRTGRPFANLGQPNLMATLMLMSAVGLAWTFESGRIGRCGLAFGIGWVTIGICLAQSRAGYLSAAAISLWWMLKASAATPAPRIRPAWIAGWLAAIALLSAALPYASAAFHLAGDRPTTLFDNNGRLPMWKQIAQGILESPWIGYGWDHTATAQMAGAITYPGVLTTSYAHNIVLDALAWVGIPLATAAVAAMAYWLATRAWRARTPGAVHAFALALPVMVHSIFEFPFAYAVFLFPLGMALGAVEADDPGPSRVFAVPRWFIASITAALTAVGVQVVREYLPAEQDFRFVRFEAMHIGKTPAEHTAPQFVLLTQIGALLDLGRIKVRPDMTAQEVERVRMVANRYPWAPLAMRLAFVLEATGRHEQAQQQLRMIHNMFGPTFYRDVKERMEESSAEWKAMASGPRQ